jgi:hypothetical protein
VLPRGPSRRRSSSRRGRRSAMIMKSLSPGSQVARIFSAIASLTSSYLQAAPHFWAGPTFQVDRRDADGLHLLDGPAALIASPKVSQSVTTGSSPPTQFGGHARPPRRVVRPTSEAKNGVGQPGPER